MATRYIFASEIQEALNTADKELTLPKGCRLSPQAADMIREYKLRVTYVDPEENQADLTDPPDAPHSVLPDPAAKTAEETVAETVAEAAKVFQGEEIDEAQIEAIAQRVLARLADAKGEAPPAPALSTPQAATAANPAPDDDLIICRCEEITKGQIKQAIRDGLSSLNGIKRVTRAGMGLCQGQTCARLVAGILAQELGLPPSQVEPTTARAPSRPVAMAVLAHE